MTFEQRMAELGVDLSDLPSAYSYSQMIKADLNALDYLQNLYPDDIITLDKLENYLWFILHLTDIIDRMETRIDNLTGERDYLLDLINYYAGCNDCRICLHRHPVIPTVCSDESKYVTVKDGEYVACQFEYASVSEDWRVDDECTSNSYPSYSR